MLMSMLFYVFGGFTIGLLARDMGLATIVYLIFHCLFWYPVFHLGLTPIRVYVVCYTAAYITHAFAGWFLASILNVKSVFCTESQYDKWTQYRIVAYRWAVGIGLCCLFPSTTLLFDLLDGDYKWYGFGFGYAFVVFALGCMYFGWEWNWWPKIAWPFKKLSSPYFYWTTAAPKKEVDLTLEVVVFSAAYYLLTHTFMALTEMGLLFQGDDGPMYMALILAGAAVVAYGFLRMFVLGQPIMAKRIQ